MKRLRPMFSYYGSKWTLSPKYPRFDNEILIEPFAGSACYSLLYWWKKVHLYDLDETIVMLWDYLIHVSKKEIMNLPLLRAGQKIPENLSIEQKILIGFWVSKAATHPRKQMTKIKKDLGYWNHKIKFRISEQLKYIRHWKIEKKSYEDIENINALWFIDPPYFNGGHHYIKSNKNLNYNFLAHWCKSRKGNVIVCENSSATWLPFSPICNLKGMKKNTIESIWIKYVN